MMKMTKTILASLIATTASAETVVTTCTDLSDAANVLHWTDNRSDLPSDVRTLTFNFSESVASLTVRVIRFKRSFMKRPDCLPYEFLPKAARRACSSIG